MANTQKSLKERAEAYIKESVILLKKYKIAIAPTINFPKRKKVPILSRLALWFVGLQGGRSDIQFKDVIDKNN